MGRPSKLIKRQKRVSVRYTLAEYLFVEQYANEKGLSISSYIRARSLDERPPTKRTPEQVQAYMELVTLANNLNQASEDLGHERIDATLDQLDEIINQLK